VYFRTVAPIGQANNYNAWRDLTDTLDYIQIDCR
jgi:hypothetical protein